MFDQLKTMKQLAGLMGNAGEMKAKFEAMQRDLAEKTVEAEAGGGAVRVTVNGNLKLTQVQLDPRLTAAAAGPATDADRRMVEQLIVEATNAALEKAQEMLKGEMASLTGGMNIPGLDRLLR